jgi:3-hydroxyisobutyrate dehydrogenase-like beta-hydroxyacid dehydrogenase
VGEGSMRVGIVGLGEMGMPMLERLCAAGHEVGFRARRQEVADVAVSHGARPVEGFGESDVVLICVFSDEQVREVAPAIVSSMREGAVLVNHTTGDPTTATWLAELAGERGVLVLDGALSGSPQSIRAGSLTLLIGGDDAVLDLARPALEAYSEPILQVGGLGDGQRVKLINNALLGAHLGLASEAERVASDMGVDPATALAAISQCSGDSSALRLVVTLGSAENLEAAAGRFLRKDAEVVAHVAEAGGIDLGKLTPSHWRDDL